MTAPIPSTHYDHQFTRRSIFIGAAASLICAPAASLMPVRGLISPIERQGPIGPQYVGFCERVMYHSLECNLRARRMTTWVNGKIVPEADARRMVAFARTQGWLPKPDGTLNEMDRSLA
jgi:hypothetical protein